jgi:hypothetical protein
MWALIASYTPDNTCQSLLFDKSYDQLRLISSDRALRYIYGSENLMVWLIIYAELFITVGFSYFFGPRNLSVVSPDAWDFFEFARLDESRDSRTGPPLSGCSGSFRRTVSVCDPADERDGPNRVSASDEHAQFALSPIPEASP